MSFFKKIFGQKKAEIRANPVTVLESESPDCPIVAVVEQDDKVAYMYLYGPENSKFGIKSCWIRNIVQAPSEIDSDSLNKGIPPMLPEPNCKFPLGQGALNKEHLAIVWLEEGDGAALLEGGVPIAIIPSWSGVSGFMGYSNSCTGQGDFAWELNLDNSLLGRIESAIDFSEKWNDEVNPFNIVQPQILERYEDYFGKSEKYYAIDREKGQPIGLYIREGEEKTVFASVAMSLSPMPQIEMYSEDRHSLNRIEMGMMLHSDQCAGKIQNIVNWISGTCALPWRDITFLGNGHTVLFDAFESSKFKSVLITNEIAQFLEIDLSDYRGSKVSFLWMVPITESERNYAIENGSPELVNLINESNEDFLSLDRSEVV